MNRQVVALGGTRKLASADTGPRISSVRLAIGYAVMVAALAAFDEDGPTRWTARCGDSATTAPPTATTPARSRHC
jgi:hypothetical protein